MGMSSNIMRIIQPENKIIHVSFGLWKKNALYFDFEQTELPGEHSFM